MLVWQHRLLNTPIVSLQTGGTLGLLQAPIIDPKNLKLEAFYCEGPLIREDNAVLYSEDIREYGELGALVNDADVIMPLDEDLVRLQQLTEKNFQLIGKKVVTEKGHKLGKITDYTIETDSFIVIKLHVKKPLFQGINDSSFFVDRTQIRKITDDTIVVAEADMKDTPVIQTGNVVREKIENPFRKPMPETSDQN